MKPYPPMQLGAALALCVCFLPSPAPAQTPAPAEWKSLRTVEDVYAAYPERINSLLQSLDLTRSELAKVKAAIDRNDQVQASTELLEYYRTGQSGRWLRREPVTAGQGTTALSEQILNDEITVQGDIAKVPRDPKTGSYQWRYTGPRNDKQYAMGVNRHFHLQQLFADYLTTGNERYVTRLDEQLRDWIVNSQPYPGKKSSDAMWGGLEVSFRVKTWADVFFGLQQDPHLLPATRLLLLTSLVEHTNQARNFHNETGNWVTMELSGLATVAYAWPEFRESAAWTAYARNKLEIELGRQNYPDGVQKELAPSYHFVALTNFEFLAAVCERAGDPVSETYRKGMESMWNYLAYSMAPNGIVPLSNDSDQTPVADALKEAADRYHREDWRYIATNGQAGTAPKDPPSAFFPWAGQLISRNGWDAKSHWSFFDIGPWGLGHQQQDHLHLSVAAYGRDVLVDTGRFAYSGELAQRLFRPYAQQSRGHNVILIDGQGQLPGPRVTNKPLNEQSFRITKDWDYASSQFNAFEKVEGTASHRRAVLYLRNRFWIVLDLIETDRPRDISPLWHFHPKCTVHREGMDAVSVDAEVGNVRITPVGPVKWQMDLIKGQDKPVPQGWFSPTYNQAEPSETAVYQTHLAETKAFAWIIRPALGPVSPIKAEWIEQTNEGVSLKVTEGNAKPVSIFIPFRNPDAVKITP